MAASLLLMSVMAGCGSGGPRPIRTEVVPFSPEEQAELRAASAAAYRLRPGDRLAVDFKYEDELDSTNLLVLPDGHLTLPGGIDPVPARGLTIAQLDSALTFRFAVDYRHPDLSVIVESLADLHVYVFGEVERPGQVVMPDRNLGVLQAVAAAGGFTEDAQPGEAVVMRVTPDGFLLRQIDLAHLQRRGIPGMLAMDLQPYDVIYVPRSTLGDLGYFSDTVLRSLLNVGDLFWDIYAVVNIDKVDNIWR